MIIKKKIGDNMNKKTVTSNYIYNLTYQLLVLLIPLLTVPYLTRILGSNKLGIYSYTYSIVTIFFLLSSLGINTYGQREVAYLQDDKEKRTKVFWELMTIKLISSFVSILLLIIFSLITYRYSIYYQIFIIYVFANLFDITWLYQGMEDFKNVAIRNIFIKIIYFISIFIFIKNQSDLWLYILLFSMSTLLTNISFWINIKDYIGSKPSKLEIKKHTKNVIFFFIPQIASLIYTVIDKTMIGIIVPKIDNVYFYEQASYIVKTILMLITTAGTVMISKMSYAYEKKDYKIVNMYMEGVLEFVWLFGCALLFGICATIENIVPWFYGNDCLDIIKLVYYLAPLIIIIGLNNVVGIQYLIPTKQQNKYIKAVIVGAIINFVLNIIFIHIMEAIGAAIASVAAELVILLIEIYYVRKQVNVSIVIKPAIKYIVFGIIMFIPTYLIGKIFEANIYSTLVQIIVGTLIYILLLIISKNKFFYENIIGYIKNIRKQVLK